MARAQGVSSKKMARKTVIGLLFLMLPNQWLSQENSVVATDLLQRVGRTYRNVRSCYFEGLLRTEIEGEGFYQRIELPVVVSADKPDRMRVEIKHSLEGYLMVANGDYRWEFVPRLQQFTRVEAGTVRAAGFVSKPSSVLMSLLEDYSRLGQHSPRVRLLGEEDHIVGDRRVDCLLVEYSGPTPLRYVDESDQARILHIDPARNLVLQEDSNTAKGSTPYGWPAEVKHTLAVTKSIINEPLPDDLFAFAGPQGARQVSALGPNSAPSGLEASDFTLHDLNGRSVQLSNLRGKVVILEFWASWCEPCRYEMPVVEGFLQRFKDEGLVVLGVNDEDPPVARRYVEEGGYTFPTLFDKDQKVAGLYGVRAIPALFVIDRQGRIVGRHKGYGPGSEEKILDSLRKAGIE